MNDPILQDKRQEHVKFQKYAVELMERVSGKSKTAGSQLEASLANMHKVMQIFCFGALDLDFRVLVCYCNTFVMNRQMWWRKPKYSTILSSYSK